MIAFGFCTLQLLALVAPGPEVENPKTSADVVTVELQRHSIADGLETFFVTVKIARGWQVYAHPAGADGGAKLMPVLAAQANLDSAIKFAFLIDGKPASSYGLAYSPRIGLRKDHAGKSFGAYEGPHSFTAWLAWEDTMNTSDIAVRVTLNATDGKTRLKESTVRAGLK